MKLANKARSEYQSYLLRLWREGADTPWRASLQGTAKQDLQHFATVEALFAFLNAQLEPCADKPQKHEAPPE